MARGNDARSAAAEFRGQYGVMGNAEDLIQANRAAYPGELRAAQRLGVNGEATENVREDLSKVEKALDLGDDSRVLDAAVHGDKVIAVVEVSSGRTYKTVLDGEKVGLKGLRSSSSGGERPDPQGLQATAEAAAEAQRVIAEARAEAEKIVREAQEKAQKQASEKAQKAVQDAKDSAAKASKDEEKKDDSKS